MDTHPLRRWRQAEALSQDQAGDRLGVSGNTVARWERREVIPRAEQRRRIQQIAGIAEADILAAAVREAGAAV